jgi:peroxiredoxin
MELGVDLTQKHRLTFPLLFDENLTVARQFGLVFSLPENLIELYERMGIDLVKSQGNDHGELPVPATYVVNSNGVIVYAFVQADYTKRLEPQVVLDVLSR